MSKILANEDKVDALNKILWSKHFQESEISSYLLKYLLEFAINDNIPIEKTIALELYGKKDIDSSADSYVQSNV